jgi:hypothetical protein
LTADQEKKIRKMIQTKYSWKPDMYKLEWREEWDQSRVPLIVAIPTKLKVDFSPSYIIMKNGEVISMWETDGFQKVIKEYLIPFQSTDAVLIAELAVKFAIFGKPIGGLFNGSLEGRKTKKKIPRPQSIPQAFLKGDKMRLAFYTYDYELLKLYNCEIVLTINPSKFELKVDCELLT